MAAQTKPTSRSDEIRRRRANQAGKPVNPARKPANRARRAEDAPTRTPPPVMARNAAFTLTGPAARRSKKVRRRLDVALNVQGAEMRLPALPQIRFGWRLASFLLLALLAFVVYTYWNSSMYRVEEAQVTGLKRLNSTAVNAVLDVKGKQIFTLDTDGLQGELLTAFPEFSSAAVQAELPNTVMVTVTERIPVLTWKQGGRTLLVDGDGMSFPLREGLPMGDYPVIEASGSPPALALPLLEPTEASPATGIDQILDVLPGDFALYGSAKPLMTSEMVQSFLILAGKAPEKATLFYDPGRGMGWKDSRGWEVFLGQAQEIDLKLKVYRAILDQLKEEGLRPTEISVEYLHAPYFRLDE
ncbi:MAG: FtsQ-type POTRA domain-containing protein [Chloroflexota bacterium]